MTGIRSVGHSSTTGQEPAHLWCQTAEATEAKAFDVVVFVVVVAQQEASARGSTQEQGSVAP